jgi:hypothetical protein
VFSDVDELGRTDNDDLIRISGRDHIRTFSRSDLGDMIAEAVTAGTTWTIDFTMVAWDQAELNKMLKHVRQGDVTNPDIGDEGVSAEVGGVVVTSGTRSITLTIDPDKVGATRYTFHCMMSAGPEYMDMGNTVRRIAMSFTSVADGTNPPLETVAKPSPSS